MRIAVLMGGTSAERDVSLASGAQVARALIGLGHEIVAIDTYHGRLQPAELQLLLTQGVPSAAPSISQLEMVRRKSGGLLQPSLFADVDVVFLALHGGTGEDGTMQAVLDAAGICYTGSGHVGSAAAMDKDISKRLFMSAGVPTPDWLMHPAESPIIVQKLGLPLIVKPNKQGSTVGLTLVQRAEDLPSAVARALSTDREVMFERYVPGRELTVGVLEDAALAVGEIQPKSGDIFDYMDKYQPGGAKEIFPAVLPESLAAECRRLALRAHRALKLEHYSRVDFRLDPAGRLWCLEVNSLPGLTGTSLLPQSAAAMGISFPQLCETICELALRRAQPLSPESNSGQEASSGAG